jgi:hypothetical protein
MTEIRGTAMIVANGLRLSYWIVEREIALKLSRYEEL